MYDELVRALRVEPFEVESAGLAKVMNAAADAIEELSKDRDKWKATAKEERDAYRHWFDQYQKDVPRWIPVTEQLIHSGWYLVACNEWGGSAVRKAIYDEATRKWLEFPCGGPKDITKFVTHYMALPEPPKEEV